MFVYDIVTCWDKKACFKIKICPFLGLGSGWAGLGFFLGLWAMFFMFLGKTLSYALDLDQFWYI